MGEGWTGGASDIIKANSSVEDPRAARDLASTLGSMKQSNCRTPLHRSPTTARVNKTKQHTSSQSVDPILFHRPTADSFCNVPKSLREGTLVTQCTACRLYPRCTSESAKTPHHTRQLSLMLDLSCMCPESFPIPLILGTSNVLSPRMHDSPLWKILAEP